MAEENYPLLGEESIDQNYDGVCVGPVRCKVWVQRKWLGALRMRRRKRRYKLDERELAESVRRGGRPNVWAGGVTHVADSFGQIGYRHPDWHLNAVVHHLGLEFVTVTGY